MTTHTGKNDTTTGGTEAVQTWYALPGTDLAHCVESSSGEHVRSVCDVAALNAWRPASETRPTRPGDAVCGGCVQAMVTADIEVRLPLVECLGCRRLCDKTETGVPSEHPAPADTTADRHDADKPGQAPPCRGSNIRAAQHDGRDDVRAEALGTYANLTAELDTVRAEYAEAIRTWKPGDAIGYWSAGIARTEGTVQMWEKLVLSGDLWSVVSQAVVAAARRHTGSDDFEACVADARAKGAKDWLRGVNWKLQSPLTANGKDPVYKALSDILFGL